MRRDMTSRWRKSAWAFLAVIVHGWVLWAALGWTLSTRERTPHWAPPPSRVIFDERLFVKRPALFDSDVLLWGAERFQAGQDPLAPEWLGDSGIWYNYPSGWRILSFLHLHRSNLIELGWFLALAFCATLFWLIPPTSGLALALHALILSSPPGLDALGQGNGELLVVALIAVSAKFAAGEGRWRNVSSLLSLGAASALKLYPAAGFAALAARGRRLRWQALAAGAIFGFWLLLERSAIRDVIARTPQPWADAFGCELLMVRARHLLDSHSSWIHAGTPFAALVGLVARAGSAFRFAYFAVVGLGIASGLRARRLDPEPKRLPDRVLLLMGSVMFVASFGIGSSWGHRLLVLSLCIAAVARCERRAALLALLVIALWSNLMDQGVAFVVEQALMWALLFVLSRKIGENSLRDATAAASAQGAPG